MFTRLAYFFIVIAIGLGSILLCRFTQAGVVEQGSSWLTAPAQTVLGFPTKGISDFFGNIQNIGSLRNDNDKLRSDLDRLRLENARLAELERENQLLREQLGLRRAQPGFEYVPARIIGNDPNPLVKALVLNIGTREGIAEGMAVVTAEGLVGRIFKIGPTTAKVLLISDVSSSANGQVQTSHAKGVLTGSPADYLTMRYIAQGESVHTGDLIVTSGLGGMYPPGLPIGSVIDVRQKDVDMFQEARIDPSVDFDRLEYVLIITNFLPTKLE